MVDILDAQAKYETNPAVTKMIDDEAAWIPLAAREPPAKAGPAKEELVFNQDGNFAFVREVFKFNGTVFAEVWPQLLCSLVWCGVVAVLYNIDEFAEYGLNGDVIYDDDKEEHWHIKHASAWNYWKKNGLPADVKPSVIKTLLGFLLVFKAVQGYGNFNEGRKQLGGICNNARELAQAIYSSPLKDKSPETMERAEVLRKIIRRKLNLMYAFMRHVTRESNEGFVPGCGLEGEDFVGAGPIEAQNWYKDPSKPAIANLISLAERDVYAAKGVGVRPAAVQAEINMLCGMLSLEMKYPNFFLNKCHLCTEGMMNLFKGTARLVTTPVPMPYAHMLYMLNFIYCFLTPVDAVRYTAAPYPGAFRQKEGTESSGDTGGSFFLWGSGWLSSAAVIIYCYGILEIAALMQNPFGHDAIDHDMGGSSPGKAFAVRLHNETRIVGKAAGSNDGNDYTQPTQVVL